MRKSVIAVLLVVVLLFSSTYAEDVDLSQMSTKELEDLQQRIKTELKNRPAETEQPDEKERRGAIQDKYEEWLKVYDFDSILADIASGNHGMSEECASDVKEKAEQAKAILDRCNTETDQFTGKFMITHPLLESFGNSCRVFPYIDEEGFNLILGFPYDDSLHYDQIYLKCGDDIYDFDRFDDDHGFDIQFETLNEESWEYSTLEDVFIGDSLESVSFREEGSIRKVDYALSADEEKAVADLNTICDLKMEIHSRLLKWQFSED